ncbi:septum site-determining protein Ssd [Streptomyces sp. NPDC059578]|uniref:septum site-determining protein Ssd n=1 Tax=Streptomyces sp. NPDC059578 TaxID=3346874 RepID=UPI003695A3C3
MDGTRKNGAGPEYGAGPVYGSGAEYGSGTAPGAEPAYGAGRGSGEVGRSSGEGLARAAPVRRVAPVPAADPVGRSRDPGGPLVLTEDPALLDDLLRLCAAAGARAEVRPGPPEPARWDSAPLVLVGPDAVPRLRATTRRRHVVLVSRAPADPERWRHAVEIGADHALVLPDGEEWLVDRIADVAEGADRPALTVGVLGGSGGVGASTLACALAVTSARAGRRTLLVDADPLGGGLDVALGGEDVDGLRWPAFAGSRGRVGGAALEEALPALHGVRVLSWDRGEPVPVPPPAVRAVLAAARRRGGAVVVDLPRRVDGASAQALAQVDVGLLVVAGGLRAVAAAGRVAAAVRPVLRDLRVVVPAGRPERGGPDGPGTARLLGLPYAGELPREAGLSTAQEDGRPPGHDPRSPLARFCTAFWERAAPGDGAPGGSSTGADGGADGGADSGADSGADGAGG